jgi:hypothetical protein
MGTTASVIASAKKALNDADNFGQRETGNRKAGGLPSYKQARAARPTASTASTAAAPPSTDNREFAGVRANQSNELNAALASREQARKALE